MHFDLADLRVSPTRTILLSIGLFALLPAATSQVSASGQTLTVSTANLTATFQGPDMVGLTNALTGESYL
ncbi:MAG: hypothetical protein ACRD9L_11075, partial [Bryobacteraceae bacterium]